MLQRHPGRFESTRRRFRTFRTFIELLSASMVGLDRGIHGYPDDVPDEGTTSSMVGPGEPMEWPSDDPDESDTELPSDDADEGDDWDTAWSSDEEWLSDEESESPAVRGVDLYAGQNALDVYGELGHFLRAAMTYPNLPPDVRRASELVLARLDQVVSGLVEMTPWEDLPPASQRMYDEIGTKISAIASQNRRKFNLRKLGESVLELVPDGEGRRGIQAMIELLTTFKLASKNRSLPKWLRTGFKQASNLQF